MGDDKKQVPIVTVFWFFSLNSFLYCGHKLFLSRKCCDDAPVTYTGAARFRSMLIIMDYFTYLEMGHIYLWT